MNSVLVTQWIERPPGVKEVMGSIPVGDCYCFTVPRSCHVDQFTFHKTNMAACARAPVNLFTFLCRPPAAKHKRGMTKFCVGGT